MDEAKVKEFLKISAGSAEETAFSDFLGNNGGDLTSAIAEYLDAAVDAGSKNGSPEYQTWCKGVAADILGGKYASLADVQAAADAFAAS